MSDTTSTEYFEADDDVDTKDIVTIKEESVDEEEEGEEEAVAGDEPKKNKTQTLRVRSVTHSWRTS